ncbi:hypothetical protein JCM3766R1_005325 [Sporobolomyces carnicolor]
MFKRPHSSKTTTPIRSSDLRKLREQVSSAFDCADSIKRLLPDGSLSGKATTHLDEPVTIYYAPAASSSTDPDPRFFRLGKGTDGPLVPTSYAFDLVPTLLPHLETAQQVVDNLTSGSALFTAGVSQRSLRGLPDTIQPGDLVSVVVFDQPETVVAVGQLGASKDDLLSKSAQDKKGKAVLTLHARGDYLWESGSKVSSSSPSGQPSTSKASDTTTPPAGETVTQDKLVSSLASSSISGSNEESQLTPAQVDDVLHAALLLSLQTVPPASYPIPASSFYSSHILPNRPATPASHSVVDLKKSSYKKLASLFKFASKRGWLVSKEVRGDLVVMSGNQQHEDVANLRSYKTVAMAESSNASTSAAGGAGDGKDATTAAIANGGGGEDAATSGAGSSVTVNEYYKPSSSTVKQILSMVPHSRPPHDLYPSPTLKQLFLSYLTSHHLVHPNSQKHFLVVAPPSPPPRASASSSLNLSLEDIAHQELIVSILTKKGETLDEFKEGVMTKDEGFKRFIANSGNFTEYWGLSNSSARGTKADDEGETIQKGKPHVIKVSIKNVGKRQVTLISGHENWNELVNSDRLAEELKHKSASSVSIQPLAGSAKKHQTPKVEIMCQGTHDKLVTSLLVAKGVPKRFVEVDLTKSKK